MLDFWDSKPFIDAANILVASDEPLRALKLLDNLPGYYRDFVPKEITKLKIEILKNIATNTLYSSGYDPILTTVSLENNASCTTLRWEKIRDDVKAFNEKEITPHIIDMGPGEYWLPQLLKHVGLKFTYDDITMSMDGKRAAQEHFKDYYSQQPTDRPTIFVACEIIEHLHHEEDIASECYKLKTRPAIIHISTPRYTFDTRLARLHWKTFGPIGHLRTYTLTEFENVVCKMFPEYDFVSTDSRVLHLRGEKI